MFNYLNASQEGLAVEFPERSDAQLEMAASRLLRSDQAMPRHIPGPQSASSCPHAASAGNLACVFLGHLSPTKMFLDALNEVSYPSLSILFLWEFSAQPSSFICSSCQEARNGLSVFPKSF